MIAVEDSVLRFLFLAKIRGYYRVEFSAGCPVLLWDFYNYYVGGLAWDAHVGEDLGYSLDNFLFVFRAHACPDVYLYKRHINHQGRLGGRAD